MNVAFDLLFFVDKITSFSPRSRQEEKKQKFMLYKMLRKNNCQHAKDRGRQGQGWRKTNVLWEIGYYTCSLPPSLAWTEGP